MAVMHQRQVLLGLRERLGIPSQVAMAEATGISASMLAAVETGKRNLSRESIEKIVASLSLGEHDRQRLLRAMTADRAEQEVGDSIEVRLAALEQRVAELEAAQAAPPERHLRAADSESHQDPGPAPKKRTQGRRPKPPVGGHDG